MSFRKGDNEKLNVAYVNACIYHYGWVKAPEAMQKKQLEFQKLWHSDEWVEENITKVEEFDYSKIDSVARFTGTHPKVMEQRLKRLTREFSFDPSKRIKPSLRRRMLNRIYSEDGVAYWGV